MASTDPLPIRVGVLALQGAFREHIALLRECQGVAAVEVRKAEQLRDVDGLIVPGGESTTMALIAERWGLLTDLKEFRQQRRPVWGTCAGLIFLADKAVGQKEGGQALMGGLDCTVQRNFFGAQINSFETELPVPQALPDGGQFAGRDTFRAVFIRAPAVLESGPDVETLLEYRLSGEEAAAVGRERVGVAVRSGALLATAFHPELTADSRWHRLFVDMVRADKASKAGSSQHCNGACHDTKVAGQPGDGEPERTRSRGEQCRPADMPVYGRHDRLSQ